LPFQALRAPDGKYLLEHTALSLAPSLSTLAAMHELTRHRTAAPVSLVAFGNPPPEGDLPALPQAETQVREIAKLYGAGAHVYLGANATEGRLKEECASARVLHIATHGVLNDANPMYSHLVLARDAQVVGLLGCASRFPGDKCPHSERPRRQGPRRRPWGRIAGGRAPHGTQSSSRTLVAARTPPDRGAPHVLSRRDRGFMGPSS
jgi:hypothetical protein